MAKQKVYQLEGKTPDEVKASFIFYMGDKNAVSKQIKDAANSRYAKIDSIETIRSLVRTLFKVENVFQLIDFGQIQKVSDALTKLIEKEKVDSVKHDLKNQRSYINKYKDFLAHCADLFGTRVDTSTEYNFVDDPDKPFISEEKFNLNISYSA